MRPSSQVFGTASSRTKLQSSHSLPVIQIRDGTFYRNQPSLSGRDPTNPPLFPKLNFSLPASPKADQYWAIVGPSSSGKTTLLEIFRGQHLCFPPRARSFPYLSSEEVRRKDHRLRSPERAIQYVGFGAGKVGPAGSGVPGTYLSARYESRREETDFSLLDYLNRRTQLNAAEDEPGSEKDQKFAVKVIKDLDLQSLLLLPMRNLSNGQTRRARIARALLGKPEVLLLDEPFMGLDPPTVSALSPLLHQLAAAGAPRLIMSLRIQDPIPAWLSHLIYLSSKAEILFQGRKDALDEELKEQIQGIDAKPISLEDRARLGGRIPLHKTREMLDLAAAKRRQDQGKAEEGEEGGSGEIPSGNMTLGEFVVEMEGVQVRYGDRVVLGDWDEPMEGASGKGLCWSVRRGERWGLFGPNGSGKTTLLSLICSDHPQSYSLPIRLFGQSRLPRPGHPALSVFDLQARIGHSSPEIHHFFPRHLSLRQTLESAWADTFLARAALNGERDKVVDACLRWFQADLNPAFAHGSTDGVEVKGPAARRNISRIPSEAALQRDAAELQELELQEFLSHDLDWADSLRFGDLSFSAQRVALFLRAIIKKPDLIILDEAFSGMDDRVRDKCMRFLEHGDSRILAPGQAASTIAERKKFVRISGLEARQALICVSHVREEIPPIVREWLWLPSPNEGLRPKCGRFMKLLSSAPEQFDRIWTMSSAAAHS